MPLSLKINFISGFSFFSEMNIFPLSPSGKAYLKELDKNSFIINPNIITVSGSIGKSSILISTSILSVFFL
jgi:hypothetical protein